MIFKTPVSKIHKNMMLTKSGDVWAYYKVSPKSINVNNREEINANKKKMELFLNQIQKYKDFHMMLYPKQMNLEERFRDIAEDLASETYDLGMEYCTRAIESLERDIGMITEEGFVVGVCLKNDTKETFKRAFEKVSDGLMRFLGYEVVESDGFFDDYANVESDLANFVRSIGGEAMDTGELFYTCRYPFVRGINHSVETEKVSNTEWSVSDTILDPGEWQYIKMNSALGESYISFVPVAYAPDDVTNMHLFDVAGKFSFPCELHVKGQFQNISKVRSKLSKYKKRLKISKRDARATGDKEGNSTIKAAHMLNELENNLDAKEAYLAYLATFVVTGKTKEECKKNAHTVIERLALKNIKAVQPLADQMKLFYKCLPGYALPKDKLWLQEGHPSNFAELLFGVTNKLGNNVGFYIGRIDNTKNAKNVQSALATSRKPILYHPFIVNKGLDGAVTDSPHGQISGETGKGKTYLMTMLFLYTTLLSTKTLYIDPKMEKRRWFTRMVENKQVQKHFPKSVEWINSFKYVTLDATKEENHGVLDPIVFLDTDSAKEVCEAVFEQVYDMKGKDDIEKVLLSSIKEVIKMRANDEKVGLLHVVEKLEKHEERVVAKAGELIRERIDGTVLELLFSDGTVDGMNLDNKTTILEVTGLTLPDEKTNPQNYQKAEKYSVAVMICLGKFCEKFGSENPDEETVEFIDEAWMILKSPVGKAFIKNSKRIGRSLNNAIMLSTISVLDCASEDDHGQFGTLFAFDEPQERDEILKALNLELTDENRETLSTMKKGQCMYRDPYGRAGKIAIHCPYPEVHLALQTVSKTASSNAEKKYA